MGLSGNQGLIGAGYSPEHLAYVDAVAAERGISFSYDRDAQTIYAVRGGHSIAAQADLLRGAGIGGRAINAGEVYQVYAAGEPSVKTSLTENEIIFPMPSAQERNVSGIAGNISFNPLAGIEQAKKGLPAEAQIKQNGKTVGTLLIRPVFPEEKKNIVGKLLRGQNIEFWRYKAAGSSSILPQAKPTPAGNKQGTYAPFGLFQAPIPRLSYYQSKATQVQQWKQQEKVAVQRSLLGSVLSDIGNITGNFLYGPGGGSHFKSAQKAINRGQK
jgi:hypothetical protein